MWTTERHARFDHQLENDKSLDVDEGPSQEEQW